MATKKDGRWWRGDGAWLAGSAVLAAGGSAGASLAALAGGGPVAGLFLHGLTLAGVAGALLQARRARLWADKVSTEIDTFSTRLVSLESRAPAPDRGAGVPPQLRSSLAEVTGEIALLGNLVRDLAVTVSAQDREMAELRALAEARLAEARDAEGRDAEARHAEAPLSPPAPAWPEPQRLEPVRPDPVRLMPPLPMPAQNDLPRPASEPLAPDEPDEAPLAASRSAPADAADKRRIAAIVEAFEADRIELHLQPVVQLPQRKVRFYEALARLRLADDTVLVPAEFLAAVERVGLAGELDRRVIARACTVARHLASRGSEALVSCNVSPRSLAEPGFLRSVARIFDGFPDIVGRVVLEVSQRCWRTLDAERAGALAVLRDRGVPFALDRAVDARLDPLALAERGVRYLKLPASLILRPGSARDLDIEPADLAAALGRAGIRLVAERVEREEDVPDLIDLDVPLAQGFVFAPPRPVRTDVVQASTPEPVRAPAPEAPAAPAPAARPAPLRPTPLEPIAAETKLPYRTFLRRAG